MFAQSYARSVRLVHWGMAVLILLTLPAGWLMVQPGIDRGLQNAMFLYHKNVGVVLLLLVLVRLYLRLRNPAPPLPAAMPAPQRMAAHASHGLLYALMVIVPLAGYVRVRAGGFPIEMLDAIGFPALVPRSEVLAATAKSVHYYGGVAIMLVLAAHIGAAIFHGVVKKDGIFSRMWPPAGRGL